MKPVRKKKSNRSLFYRISAWLHLWLGLITGIVMIIVSLTGAALVFEQELRVLFQPFQTVASEGRQVLPPSALKEAAIKAYHLPSVSAVVYQGKDRCAVVPYYADRKQMRLNYIDPYTGKALHSKLLDKDFFRIMLVGHYNLWLPRVWGKPIVAYSTLIFVITLLTGLVLWWPKKWNKHTRKQSFQIKWGATTKRLNYDLHNVFGFYALSIGLVLGLTGMVYGMKWFSDPIYKLASGGVKKVSEKKVSDSTLVKTSAIPDEDLLFEQWKPQVEKGILMINYPTGKAGTWNVYAGTALGRSKYMSDTYEQVSLRSLKTKENGGDKYMKLNYDLHVGAVGGIFTKVLAFLVCIICASLPVTGFIVWWGKK